MPPPRRHRHRYHGFFAPNHPLRPTVTAPAIGNLGTRADAASSLPFPQEEGRGEGTPPTSWAEILQVHDDRDAIQASPDDLPVIDISSL